MFHDNVYKKEDDNQENNQFDTISKTFIENHKENIYVS